MRQYPNVATEPEQTAPRTLTSINDDIIYSLGEAKNNLTNLLNLIRGTQPQAVDKGDQKLPERTVLGDGERIRAMSWDVVGMVQELGSLL